MSCNGSLQLVYGLVFTERNIFFGCSQRTVCGASGKVWNVFVLITREGKSDENKRSLWIITKASPSCPPLWSFQDMPSVKIIKKIHQKKKNTWFFSVVCWWDLWRTLSPNRGHQGNLVGKEIPTQKNADIAGLLAISCSQCVHNVLGVPRKVVSFFVTTYRETSKKGFLS